MLPASSRSPVLGQRQLPPATPPGRPGQEASLSPDLSQAARELQQHPGGPRCSGATLSTAACSASAGVCRTIAGGHRQHHAVLGQLGRRRLPGLALRRLDLRRSPPHHPRDIRRRPARARRPQPCSRQPVTSSSIVSARANPRRGRVAVESCPSPPGSGNSDPPRLRGRLAQLVAVLGQGRGGRRRPMAEAGELPGRWCRGSRGRCGPAAHLPSRRSEVRHFLGTRLPRRGQFGLPGGSATRRPASSDHQLLRLSSSASPAGARPARAAPAAMAVAPRGRPASYRLAGSAQAPQSAARPPGAEHDTRTAAGRGDGVTIDRSPSRLSAPRAEGRHGDVTRWAG